MPCTLTGSFEGDRALIAGTTVTHLTQLLCGACKLLEDADIDMSGVCADVGGNNDLVQPQYLDEWWKTHQRMDAKKKRGK